MRSDRDVELDRGVERTVMREPVRSGSADSTGRIRTADRGLSTPYRYDALSGPASREGYVYFAQEWGNEYAPIKIGFSRDVAERIRLLEVKTGLHLRVLAWMPAVLQTERDLHRRYATQRVRGEWFRPSPKLLKDIELARTLHNDPSLEAVS